MWSGKYTKYFLSKFKLNCAIFKTLVKQNNSLVFFVIKIKANFLNKDNNSISILSLFQKSECS